MKSLAERKKFRQQQRAAQMEDAGLPIRDTGIVLDEETGDKSEYADMTIKELHAAAAKLGTEVPKDKTLLADIREYVENFAKFKAQEKAEKVDSPDGKPTGWKAGN